MIEIEELLKTVDIVEYISQFVDLEEKSGEFWGLSPFQDEKTPSFSIRRETGTFYDFSSGIGGNLLTFIRCFFKCSRRESLKKLADYAGYDGVVKFIPEKMYATQCCKKYKQEKNNSKPYNPTIFQESYMDRFEHRDDKLKIWEDEGISRESLDKYSIMYDPLSNRLVYPIRDLSGRIVNISGRALDPDWKEKGERKYTYFTGWGGAMNVIYGLYDNMDSIKQNHEVIIFEGCKSVLMADTWGIHNTGALMTSHLSNGQMKILAALGCDVVFALDKEIRVRDDRNIQKLKRYVNVFYLYDPKDLLDNKDAPVDKGEDVFRELYERRLRLR